MRASSRLTVAAWLDDWISQIRLTHRPGTVEAYTRHVAALRDELGPGLLHDLSAADIQRALAECAPRLSPTGLHHAKVTLSVALSAAVRQGVLDSNPAVAVIAPRRGFFEATTLRVEQAQRLVEVSYAHPLGPLLHVALATGCRRGELLALQWSDVDLTAGTLTIVKSKSAHVWEPDAGPTKTLRGRRTIRIAPSVIQHLRDQRRRVGRLRLSSPEWQERDLVFPDRNGNYLAVSGFFYRQFETLLARAGCPRIRFHDLRHTAATLMLRGGVGMATVSRVLGHSDVTTTMRLYAHTSTEDLVRAALTMESVLAGDPLDKRVG